MWPLFNPTIEVVTFRLHGRCMLAVFSLPAFTRLGHECQDVFSPYDGMYMYLGLYSNPKGFSRNGVRTHVNSKGKIPSTGKKILPREGWNPRRCIKQDSETSTLPTSYSSPPAGSDPRSPALEEAAICGGGGKHPWQLFSRGTKDVSACHVVTTPRPPLPPPVVITAATVRPAQWQQMVTVICPSPPPSTPSPSRPLCCKG